MLPDFAVDVAQERQAQDFVLRLACNMLQTEHAQVRVRRSAIGLRQQRVDRDDLCFQHANYVLDGAVAQRDAKQEQSYQSVDHEQSAKQQDQAFEQMPRHQDSSPSGTKT